MRLISKLRSHRRSVGWLRVRTRDRHNLSPDAAQRTIVDAIVSQLEPHE
jgi:hypothetical protein